MKNKRILCPTDFSDCANNAVDYAASFAQAIGASLTLFKVHSLFELTPGESLSHEPTTIVRFREQIARQAAEVSSAFGIGCTSEVLVSDDALGDLIRQKGSAFDLIIMGTNGPDDLHQFFFGTNAYQVLRKVNLPVMIIPEIIRYTRIKRVVYAYDCIHEGIPPMKQLEEVFSFHHPDIHILQLTHKKFSSDDQIVWEHCRQKLLAKKSLSHRLAFTNKIADHYPEAIQKFMPFSDADVLVLEAHRYTLEQKLFHKSMTRQLTMNFMNPVLIVHE